MSGRRAIGLAATLCCVLGSVAACGDAPGYDATVVETYLANSQASVFSGATVGAAHCPDDVTLKEKVTFTCMLDVSGASVPYEVRLTDVRSASPRIAIRLTALVIPVHAVRKYLKGSLSRELKGAAVDCGGNDVVVTEVGKGFDCTLTLGPNTQTVHLSAGEDGRVTVAS